MAERERRYTIPVLMKFEPDQLALIDRAADSVGSDRSTYVRAAALRAARQELPEAAAALPEAR